MLSLLVALEIHNRPLRHIQTYLLLFEVGSSWWGFGGARLAAGLSSLRLCPCWRGSDSEVVKFHVRDLSQLPSCTPSLQLKTLTIPHQPSQHETMYSTTRIRRLSPFGQLLFPDLTTLKCHQVCTTRRADKTAEILDTTHLRIITRTNIAPKG